MESEARVSFKYHAEQAVKQGESMSMDSAADIVGDNKHASKELVSMIQEKMGIGSRAKHKRRHRHHKLRHHQNHAEDPANGEGASDQAANAYAGGAEKALETLNQMILEAIEQMDFEVVRCDSVERQNLAMIYGLRRDMNMFDAMTAGALVVENEAKGAQTRFEGLRSNADDEFKKNKETCDTERADIVQKLAVVKADNKVMRDVVRMIEEDCGKETTLFMQCEDPVTRRKWTEMRPNQKMQNALTKVTDPKVRMMLQQVQQSVFAQDQRQPDGSSNLTLAPDTRDPTPGQITRDAMQTAKCALSGPMCPKIRERFTDLAGEVLDSLNELKQMLKNLNLHCKQTLDAITSLIENFDNVLLETNEKLSQATKDYNTYSGEKVAKSNEHDDVHKEHLDTMTACKVKIENLASEKCALIKIRGELLNMDKLPSNITDCEVGHWEPDACTADCGGGSQNLTRSVTPGWRGCACPASEAKQSCNEGRCPVDCEMYEWSEWGTCTALCDGGIKERARGIKVQSVTERAEQCGETSETVPCNVQACSTPCELSDWQGWTETCSKPCGGGQLKRIRKLVKAATGSGTCPGFYDETRYEVRKCNEQACPATEVQFTCTAMLDVVIVIDGSASIEEEGWKQVKQGAASLARRFTGSGAKISSLLFSGPDSIDMVGPCMGQIDDDTPNFAFTDTAKQCGMEWVTHFSDNQDGEQTATKIEALAWPQSTTLTSMALSLAAQELRAGRADANSIVIVITDGAPMSVMDCAEQSDSLKKKARLMWVPVGNKFEDDEVFRPWASTPWQENIVRVEDLHYLTMPWFANEVLTNFCPELFAGDKTVNEFVMPTETATNPFR